MDNLIDIYKELDIPIFSDVNGLKSGLRKAYIKYHPDNFVNAGLEIQKRNEAHLTLLCQICNYLYDEENKRNYDVALRLMKEQVEVKEDVSLLIKRRYDLELQLLKRKNILLMQSFDSHDYISLKEKEQNLSLDIIKINQDRSKLAKRLDSTIEGFNKLFLIPGILNFPEIFQMHKNNYDVEVAGLKMQQQHLDERLLRIYRDLEQIKIQIKNFPSMDYYMQDEEYCKISGLLEEVKEKIEHYNINDLTTGEDKYDRNK